MTPRYWFLCEGNAILVFLYLCPNNCFVGYCLFVCSFTPHSSIKNLYMYNNFLPTSTLMAIEQWGFFNMPHLLWNRASFYNDHLRGPITLTPIVQHLTVELPLPVFITMVCRVLGSNPDIPHASWYCYLRINQIIQ